MQPPLQLHHGVQDGVEAPPEETLEGLGKGDLGILDSQDEIEDLSYATMFATTLTLEAAKQLQQQQPDPAAAAFSQPMRMDDPVIERPAASHVSSRGCLMKRITPDMRQAVAQKLGIWLAW